VLAVPAAPPTLAAVDALELELPHAASVKTLIVAATMPRTPRADLGPLPNISDSSLPVPYLKPTRGAA
jgi:hypothetical protein